MGNNGKNQWTCTVCGKSFGLRDFSRKTQKHIKHLLRNVPGFFPVYCFPCSIRLELKKIAEDDK